MSENISGNVSDKLKTTDLLLCIFLGTLGVHRFYEGKIGTGILWLCTLDLCGIGRIVDVVLIATNKAKDKNGLPIVN